MAGSEERGDIAAVPPKADPETLVLRGRPLPVVRFRRSLIIGLAGAVAAALIALVWMALEPPSFRMAAEEPPGEPLSRAAPDALAGIPASYGDVPRLGPPLPGDLGRPILEQQRRIEDAEEGAIEAERARAEAAERRAAELKAVRAAPLMVQLEGRDTSAAAPPVEGSSIESAADSSLPEVLAGTDLGGQQRKIDFAGSAPGDTNPHALRAAPSPWTLSAGTVIPASLITGLNSDLPGMVLAQVTENVRDSATGRTVLIPQGARLIGSYDSVVAFGQRRALLVWQRILFPDGSSVLLDNMPATDPAGFAGLEDRVDFHMWRLLKGIALSTLLGVGTELSFGSAESDLVRAVRESAQQNGARAGDRITMRNLDVQPTITVRPGWQLRALVHKDLVLRPWKG